MANDGQETTKKAFFDKAGRLVPVDTKLKLISRVTEFGIEYWEYIVVDTPHNPPSDAVKPDQLIRVHINQASDPAYISK